MKINIKDYEECATEDEIIGSECQNENCGMYVDYETTDCPRCNAEDMIHDTSHEGLVCHSCKGYIEMYDSVHFLKDSISNKCLCVNCYDSLTK